MTAAPAVTVLLATRDGLPWLPAQLESVLGQTGVDVHVVVSDDLSTDGTWEWLQEQAAREPRLTLLPRGERYGSPAANFYRLLRDAELPPGSLLAFADQDDVWHDGKLARHAALVAAGEADGVSSNVVAVWPDGRRRLLRKDWPQRRLDYLFEGPGPGCTFVLSPRLAALVRSTVADPATGADRLQFHDWLVYAVCRARGWRWVIEAAPTVDYRQHERNAMGANLTVRSGVHRLRLVARSWHRDEAAALADVAAQVAAAERRPDLLRLRALLGRRDPAARVRLSLLAPQLRRRPRDRVLLGLLVVGGVW